MYFRLFIFLLTFFCSSLALARENRETISAAHLPLSSAGYHREWLKLLHYKQNFGSYKGLVINDEFYVAADGRYNPQQELEAEVEKFNRGDSSKCNFPARFMWLKSKGLVAGTLDNCTEYQKLIKDIIPNGVTLLFTDAYMSNPASLFGHTLIRIDTARKGTQMLAHGSNFGADSGTEQGLPFILKGLLGGYEGKYNLSPYWTIINTYNNIENRDIWEYHLNLTPAEQEKFVNHLYEMKNAGIRYFFLTKNCSYMILELLEAVRPDLELSKNYNFYAIPLDTLKSIKEIPGLIDNINYRPARYTKIKSHLDTMLAEQYEAFIKVINEHDYELAHLSEDEQADVLGTAYQYFQYKYTARDMELKEYRRNSFAALRRRSRLPSPPEPQISGKDPSLSHNSMQIAAGGGIYHHKSFEQFSLRPAYTGLTDDNYGLIRGAGVEVFKSDWRYYNQSHKLVLHKFTGLSVRSFVPANRVFNPISYITDLYLERAYNPRQNTEGYVAHGGFGIGKTYAFSNNLYGYGLLRVQGEYGGFIPSNQWLGTAPELGLFGDFEVFRLHLSAQKSFATRKFGEYVQYNAAISLAVTRNLSFDIEYMSRNAQASHIQEEIVGLIKYSL